MVPLKFYQHPLGIGTAKVKAYPWGVVKLLVIRVSRLDPLYLT